MPERYNFKIMDKAQDHDCALKRSDRCAYCESEFREFNTKINDLLSKNNDIKDSICQVKKFYEKSFAYLKDAKEDVKIRLQNHMKFAKEEIDIQIESLKCQLDELREKMYESLDSYQSDLLKNIDSNRISDLVIQTIKPNYEQFLDDILNKPNKITKETLEYDIKYLKILNDSSQQYLDTKFKIRIADCKIKHEDFLSSIRCEINRPIKAILNKNWIYRSEQFDESKLRRLVKINTRDVKSVCYLGEDLLVTANGSELKMWNIKDGSCVKDFNLDAHVIHITNDRKLIAAYRSGFDFKIYDLNSDNSLNLKAVGSILEICSLPDRLKTIIFRHKIGEESVISFNVIENSRLQVNGTIHSASEIHCMQSLPNCMLVTGDDEGLIKVYTPQQELLRVVESHEGPVRSLKLSKLNFFYSLGNDNVIKQFLIKPNYVTRYPTVNCAVQFGNMAELPAHHVCVVSNKNDLEKKFVVYDMILQKLCSEIPLNAFNNEPSENSNDVTNVVYCNDLHFAFVFKEFVGVFVFV